MRSETCSGTVFSMQLFLAVLVLCNASCGSTISSTTTQKPSGLTLVNATCPFRTVNYITHGLPQQCLTSSRRTTTSTTSTSATVSLPSASVAANESSPGVENITSISTRLDASAASSNGTTPPSTAITSPRTIVPPSISASSATALPDVSEEESPLEDEKFMSFEDWKKQNLLKAGQSEHVGKGVTSEQHGTRKRPANIHSALDSIGDDAEIDLDFSGFIPDGPDLGNPVQLVQPQDEQVDVEETASPKAKRSKDAGTTCKERFNYASFDCAANVLKYNPEAQSASSVLGENKDSYMLNQCSAQNKHLIVELCDDIAIDTLVLANFEFFSSMFRTFRVSVSDQYPVKTEKWKTLGTFEARNSREVQAFLVDNPVIWARYLRIEFLTHYGNEYYCPVSLVRIHGTTMLEDFKQASAQAEEDEENDASHASSVATDNHLVPEAIAETLLNEKRAKEEKEENQDRKLSVTAAAPSSIGSSLLSESPTQPTQISSSITPATSNNQLSHSLTTPGQSSFAPGKTLTNGALPIETCAIQDAPQKNEPDIHTGFKSRSQPPTSTKHVATISLASAMRSKSSTAVPDARELENDTSAASDSKSAASVKSQNSIIPTNATTLKMTTNATTTDRSKPSSTAQAPSAVPTIQESFFKSVQKRLQMLETNSSLSLQYIEDQSRALRDAFNKVEQRQLAKTTVFLDYLNTTVLSELRDFRQQYDQLWQSTVIELQMQRERYQQESLAINARLGVLADELIFQKRMSMLQMILILVCLVLVLFTKGNLNTYLEMPLVQSVLARSPSSKWMNLTNLETPSQSPPLKRTSSAHQFRNRHGIIKGHRRMQSEDSMDSTLSPMEMHTPTSPVSYGDGSDAEQSRMASVLEDPKFDPNMIERPSTSPPNLPSSETPSTPQSNAVPDCETIDSIILNTPRATPDSELCQVIIEDATPPAKHLTWKLPNG